MAFIPAPDRTPPSPFPRKVPNLDPKRHYRQRAFRFGLPRILFAPVERIPSILIRKITGKAA